MGTPNTVSPLLNGGSPYYLVNKSLRFRSSASAYMNRTPSVASNRKTWTWSGWVKRGTLGVSQTLFSGYVDVNNKTRINFNSTDLLQIYDITGGATERVKVYTTQVFRDPSAWYHIVVAMDTTQATAANRTIIYINGVAVTSLSSAVYPTQNTDLYIDATNTHRIGADGDPLYFDGYMAEMNFIDGQALTPSSFGAFDTNGIWQPIRYSGTYGTNGFYLPFTNTASTTTLGYDYSGNSNNWTTNNISLTAGTTYDSMVDSPTVSNVASNYSVLNPLLTGGVGTPSSGNLVASATGATMQSSFPMQTGKWYAEVTLGSIGSQDQAIGITSTVNAVGFVPNAGGYGWGVILGRKWINGAVTTGFTTATANDVVGLAFNADAGQLDVYKNNVSVFSITGIPTGVIYNFNNSAGGVAGSDTLNWNFGQRPYVYTPPSGYVALNTANLPPVTINYGAPYMNAITYTGYGPLVPSGLGQLTKRNAYNQNVSRSLRFRASASAYLSRTPASAGSQTTWTWSGWVKRGSLGGTMALCQAGSSTANETMIMLDSDNFRLYNDASSVANMNLVSTAVFRDPSAWYHFVVAYNSTQATSTNRVSMYVNGVQITSFSTSTYPAQNQTTVWNSAVAHAIGERRPSADLIFDGYMAEVNFIDGQALTPSSFGETNSDGVWMPKSYTGTYGTNGFYLPFSNNATLEALGYDNSNSNSELITNGMFVSNVTGWTVAPGVGGTPSITWQSNHTARITNASNNGTIYYQAISTVIGQTYYAEAYVVAASIGGSSRTISIQKADDTSKTINVATVASVTQGSVPAGLQGTFTATATTTYIFINVDILGAGTTGADVTQVSVSLGGYKNSWNPFNLSITAGTTYDSMIDSPTDYALAGDYCVLNPIFNSNGTVVTYSAANLQFSYSTPTGVANKAPVQGTMNVSTGKWYYEYTEGSPSNAQVGISTGVVLGGSANGTNYVLYQNVGAWNVSSATTPSNPASFTNGDVIGVAFDVDARTVQFYKNGASQGTVTAFESGLSWFPIIPLYTSASGGAGTLNFGQRPFSYTAPSGYNALNTYNLTTPSKTWFSSGNNSGRGSATAYPDFVWIKSRSSAQNHSLNDTVRGPTLNLVSNSTAAEAGASTMFSVNKYGLTLGNDASVNSSSYTDVMWGWQAGQGTTSTNTSGSITSTTSVSANSGFSIVSYTGTGANATVGHGLGVAPSMLIVRNRDVAGQSWLVWQTSITGGQYLLLDSTAAVASASTPWNSTTPTSSVFSVGTSNSSNQSGSKMIAYCFSAVKGYSAFGSYTGNGSADGPFIYTGFRPRYILWKNASLAGADWEIIDSSRDPYNPTGLELYPDSSSAEVNSSPRMDFLSNGIKIRSSGAGPNGSGNTIIYAAFAESPFNISRAR